MSNISIHIRSAIFNLLFYGGNAVACVACLPGLLMPRKGMFFIIRTYVRFIHAIEKNVLGLDYEIRGLENLPEKGSYIVAAKHQSPYETFKLHLLFADPAIILKRELLRIPLWGWFLARIHPIAIDRSQGKEAIKQVIEGGKRVKKEGRPIIIFPQGTRVYPWQTPVEKPYKIGAARLYEAAGLPVIPLALNSGMFWPRKSWVKKPGTVIFEFLEPIEPGMELQDAANLIQQRTEHATHRLQEEAQDKYGYNPAQNERTPEQKRTRKIRKRIFTFSLIAFIYIYIFGWFGLQNHLTKQVLEYINDSKARGIELTGHPPGITGFPGPHTVEYSGEIRYAPLDIRLFLPHLLIRGIIPPIETINIELPDGLSLPNTGHPSLWSLDSLSADIPLPEYYPADFYRESLSAWQKQGGEITINSLHLTKDTLEIRAKGSLHLDQNLQPSGNLQAVMTGYMPFVQELTSSGLIDTKSSLLAISVLTGLTQTDKNGNKFINIDISLQNRKLFLGPIQLASLPEIQWAWRNQPARP